MRKDISTLDNALQSLFINGCKTDYAAIIAGKEFCTNKNITDSLKMRNILENCLKQ